MADKKENIHKGHRQNLKKQFYEGGLAPMPDHVVLELLLFFGIPYKDTNEIAHNLINTFGTFAGVFRADLKDLMAVKGMTENAACLLKLLLPAYNRYTQSLQSNRTKFFKAIEIVEFMRPKYEGSYKEKVFLLCFDKMHQLIAVKHIATGDVSAASFSFRDIASIVLENKSRNVILVHNHPNAVPAPSRQDIEVTRDLKEFLSYMRVTLEDHIIIADPGFCCLANLYDMTDVALGRTGDKYYFEFED